MGGIVCNNGALLLPRRAAALRLAMFFVLLPSLETTGVVRTKQVKRNRSHTPVYKRPSHNLRRYISGRLRASKRPMSLASAIVTQPLLFRGCLPRCRGCHGGCGPGSAYLLEEGDETEQGEHDNGGAAWSEKWLGGSEVWARHEPVVSSP
jgi:hypothetical protein